MSEKIVSDRVAKYPASRPSVTSFLVMGAMLAAFIVYIFLNYASLVY